MRKACLECVYKHLGDAAIWDIEYHLGYPIFKLYIVGSLNHASHEAYMANKELAWLLREHRINWWADPDNYHVPYESLAAYLDICLQVNDATSLPAPTDGCFAGLRRSKDGDIIYSMDTRTA
jgi:hypothetical protein